MQIENKREGSVFFNNDDNDFDYFSMNSKRIQANTSNTTKLSGFANQQQIVPTSKISDILTKHQYLVFYLEFNYFNLIKWAKDYLMGIYPEINLMVVIELDDDIKTQQKIVLVRSDEKNKYLPMSKQQDQVKKTGYRFLRIINNKSLSHSNYHKLKLQICTYSNDQLPVISEEQIYFETNPSYEMHKFQFLNNMVSNTVMKKIGNIFLSFTYKIENLKMAIEDNDEMQKKYFGLFAVSYYFNLLL